MKHKLYCLKPQTVLSPPLCVSSHNGASFAFHLCGSLAGSQPVLPLSDLLALLIEHSV